jgi:hypothetical protein
MNNEYLSIELMWSVYIYIAKDKWTVNHFMLDAQNIFYTETFKHE